MNIKAIIGFKKRFLSEGRVIYPALLVLYVILFSIQINQPPFERYPGWDWFWVDVLQAGKLTSLKYALNNFELPVINPYVGFGWNNAGDTTMPNSFLSPLNLLIIFFPPQSVIAIRTMVFLILGALGAYLFLKSITDDAFISFFGGLNYISIPLIISNFYYQNILAIFLLLPLFLYLIQSIMKESSCKKLLYFVGLSVFTVGSGDVHVFIILPAVVGVYSLFIAHGYYQSSVWAALKKALILLFVFILSSSFYIVPLYLNLGTISSATNSFIDANVIPGSLPSMTLNQYISFLKRLVLRSLYIPMEGSGALLYAPIFLYFTVVISLVFRRVVFKKNSRQAVIVRGLLVLGVTMFVVGVVFYSLPGISKMGRGVLRAHLNVIPFMVVLAGHVCFAAIARSKYLKREIYVLIIVGSLVLDLMLFSLAHPPPVDSEAYLFFVRHGVTRGFDSSNYVSVRFFRFMKDLWRVLPWLNVLFVIFLFAYSRVGEPKRGFARKSFRIGFIVGAVFLPLFSISIHNELRATQQAHWQRLGRNAYRWNSYLERRSCINEIIGYHDPNYRTLPASADVFKSGRGQNWKLIAETELHVKDRQKVLFSYRETMHPYTALLYSTFGGVFVPSNWFPPLSEQIPKNMAIVRLMGVKWVLSSDAPIDNPDLVYRGKCVTAKPPFPFDGPAADGIVNVYEVKNPKGIAFLADGYQVVKNSESLRAIFLKKDNPWERGTVYLETEPTTEGKEPATSSRGVIPDLESRVEIVKETFNSIRLNVSTPTPKYLVVSYLYRPNWKAYIGQDDLRIYRAYGGFMAVQVPLGQHVIRFQYTPLDVYLGLFLTGLAFALPLMVHVTRRKKVTVHSLGSGFMNLFAHSR